MVQVRVVSVQWDTDQEDPGDLNLPTELTLKFELDPDDDLEEMIAEKLTEATGFCHRGFQYRVEGDF